MVVLPQKPDAVVKAVKTLRDQGNGELCRRKAEWLTHRAFLQGARRFDSVNYELGQVEFTFENEEGRLRFRNEEVLRDYQIELGRFMALDIRPAVKMIGWGLNRMRQSSIGQVVLDFMAPEHVLNKIKPTFMELLLQCGCVGIMGRAASAEMITTGAALSIVPPWELLPVPFNTLTPDDSSGIMRDRAVSLTWLASQPGVKDKIRGKTDDELGAYDSSWAGAEAENASAGAISGDDLEPVRQGFMHLADGDDSEDENGKKKVVRLTEVWLTRPDCMVQRYIAIVGDVVLKDVNFEKLGRQVYKPIGVARYYPAGFYGRSWLGPLIPFCLEAEENLRAMFQNLRDIDAIGILGVPTSLGMNNDSWRMDQKPRKVFYDPDPLSPQQGIQQLQPHTLGSMPELGTNLATQYIQKIGGLSPLYHGESLGRMDSLPGISFVKEMNDVGIEAPGQSIAAAFSTAYAALLSDAKSSVSNIQAAQILDLDSNTLGVAVNDKGGLDLAANPIPSPVEVRISIKSRMPPSPTQRLQQLGNNLQMGIIDHLDYRLTVYREGLETPVGHEDEYQNWRKARFNIRTLFGDGTTPGLGASYDPTTDNPEIHLKELAPVMASPEYAMCSEHVKLAMEEYKESVESGMSFKLPDQFPTQDQAYLASAQAGKSPAMNGAGQSRLPMSGRVPG